jgi:nucleosome assembly protein 1-like 1
MGKGNKGKGGASDSPAKEETVDSAKLAAQLVAENREKKKAEAEKAAAEKAAAEQAAAAAAAAEKAAAEKAAAEKAAAGGDKKKKDAKGKKQPEPEPEDDDDEDDVEVKEDDEEDEDMNAALQKMIEDRMTGEYVIQAREFVASLPEAVQAKVKVLEGLENQRKDLEKKLEEEIRQLELKYEKLYVPLYEERKVALTSSGGIPDFWLTAMKNNETILPTITEADEAVLKHLTDITYTISAEDNQSFTLTFYFEKNSFFTNETLTKTYHMVKEEEEMLDYAEGCKINWNKEKNVTVKLVKKTQRHKTKNEVRVVTREEKVDSFFNFFSPPRMPETVAEDEDMEALDALQETVEIDMELGATFKEKIIPHALWWFTGEALQYEQEDEYDEGDEEEYEDEDGDDDDDDEDDDDEDDDEDDEPAPPPKKGGKGGKTEPAPAPASKKGGDAGGKKGGAAGGAGGAAGAPPPECKQQ